MDAVENLLGRPLLPAPSGAWGRLEAEATIVGRRVTALRSPKKRLPRQSVAAPGQQQPVDGASAAAIVAGGASSPTGAGSGDLPLADDAVQAGLALPVSPVDGTIMADGALAEDSRAGDLSGGAQAAAPGSASQPETAEAAFQDADTSAGSGSDPLADDGRQAAAGLTLPEAGQREPAADCERGDAGSGDGTAPRAGSSLDATADVGTVTEIAAEVAGEAIAADATEAVNTAADDQQQHADSGAVPSILDVTEEDAEATNDRWAAPCMQLSLTHQA